MKCIIFYASPVDEPHVKKIIEKLDEYKITHEEQMGSAHKETKRVLDILDQYKNEKVVYITVAGRSNALSGVISANTSAPVFACPPFADKMDMWVNIHSTLQMPSNVPVMTVLDPGNCALAVKRIVELSS